MAAAGLLQQSLTCCRWCSKAISASRASSSSRNVQLHRVMVVGQMQTWQQPGQQVFSRQVQCHCTLLLLPL